MEECLKLKESNCLNCYKCIRNCPVKAISFTSEQAHIVQEECILCGQCFVICPQNAKSIRDDVEKVKELLAGDDAVYASIAPSFIANYKGASIQTIEKVLKKLGFAGAEETAIGATLVKNEYDKLMDQKEHDVIISSCCHSVNLMIQKYYPKALSSLAKVDSPMQVHGMMIKQKYPNAKVVFIGPCISKKAEIQDYPGIVDYVLTFEELSPWLKAEGLVIEEGESDITQGLTRLFPTAGGILRTMAADSPGYSYLAIDGLENCSAALRDIESGDLQHCFIEMSACTGSCVCGPAMEGDDYQPIRNFTIIDKNAGKVDFDFEQIADDQVAKKFAFNPVYKPNPGLKAIEDVLHRMGKVSKDDELNCGSCGYNSCRDKAIAILMGKATESMCLPYLNKKAQSFSDTIIQNTPNGVLVLNESLQIQQINHSACQMFHVDDQNEVLGRPIVCLLDPAPFAEIVDTQQNIYQRKVYFAEYQLYMRLTLLYDQSYRIIIAILRNVTREETESNLRQDNARKTIEITDKVITKQMRTAQEIASLLGETTAETKIALTKLKETLLDE